MKVHRRSDPHSPTSTHPRNSRPARADYPDVRVIVHPECPMPVVDAADEYGRLTPMSFKQQTGSKKQLG